MTSPPGLAAVDGFWAAALGCSVADLHRPGTTVVNRPEPAAFALLRADTLDANVPSMAIARALGYRRDAATLAVRLPGPA